MGNQTPYDGWTAGQHRREGLAMADRANDEPEPARAQVMVGLAQFHLAVANRLLTHDPQPFAYLDPNAKEPPEDWRLG